MMPGDFEQRRSTRGRPRKPPGVARAQNAVKEQRTGKYIARIVDADGRRLEVGRYTNRTDANARAYKAVEELNRRRGRAGYTFNDFLEEWPQRFPRHPRTESTNLERIKRYIAPYLPRAGDIDIDEIRAADLWAIQDALLKKRLAKTTIDGAMSALSSLMRDAARLQIIEANPAAEIRVRPSDPRLDPVRGQVQRRAINPAEIHAFIAHVDPRFRAACWASFVTGCRPGELFAMARQDLDRPRQMIFLHQTADRYGNLSDGLKGTHHVADKERRGRWTLFPAALSELLAQQPAHVSGLLFPSPRGKVWGVRNFYRNAWEPAQKITGVRFSLYDARHTFASRLLAAGIPLVEVAGWMGHSLRAGGIELNNTTARVYAHATGEWREAAIAELTALVNGARQTRTLGG